MNKTLKKIIALVLVLTLSVSMFAVSFSVFATEGTTVAADAGDEEERHNTSMIELFVKFLKSVGDFFKYIFYDLFLGKPAPDIPKPPRS